MNPASVYAIAALLSYLLGSVPFGFIIAKAHGIDVRKVGSGNIGATNVVRAVGKKWGGLALACDMLKGLCAVTLIPAATVQLCPTANLELLKIVCASLAVAGHNWTVFLRFKGGKGVATSAGAVLGIAWQPLVAALVSWVAVFFVTRYVSLASVLAAVVLVAGAWFLRPGDSIITPLVLTSLCALLVCRHRTNISRLLNGTENRFSPRKKKVAIDD